MIKAIKRTAGTKIPATRSATFAIGALLAAASDTNFMTPAIVVSSPTFVASHLRYPEVFVVAAKTCEPTVFSAGMLSPVRADSSIELLPSKTMPSTGTASPGFTIKVSPRVTSFDKITTSLPSLMTVAVLGVSFIRLLIALVVLPFATVSRSLPTVISVSIIAADSKYIPCR